VYSCAKDGFGLGCLTLHYQLQYYDQ